MNGRYARQVVLPELGAEGQARLQAASVLCVGAGGLGAPALLYLAAAGVGRIGIVDGDVVSLHNLQRQVLYVQEDAGKPKAPTAASRLAALNPDIKVIPHNEMLHAGNALALLGGYDIILDGTDNFAAKYLINDACVKLGKPDVYGSILGFDGQASVFWASSGPCYRCLFPHPPQHAVPSCAEAGVLGAMAGMLGCVQAMEVVKLALGQEHCRTHHLSPLLGQLYTLDARRMRSQLLALEKNPQCPVCSLSPSAISLHASAPSCTHEADVKIPDISWAALDAYSPLLLVDVREAHEWQQGHAPQAVNIPLSLIQSGAALPDLLLQAPHVAMYCQRGVRSRTAIRLLYARGLRHLLNVSGGFDAR